MLSTQDNQFRKDNSEIYEEMKKFHENTDETFLMDEEELTEAEKKIYVEFARLLKSKSMILKMKFLAMTSLLMNQMLEKIISLRKPY